jgi:hypothetical protein
MIGREGQTSPPTGYTIREADLGRDRELIIHLWSRNLPAHTPKEHRARFEWHYGENPTGLSRCFLATHLPSGEVIGTAGVGIRRLYADQRELTAGIAIDFAVDANHRTLQPAILLARAVASLLGSDLQLLYALPNSNAKAVFRRLGYVEVGPFRRFVKVLDVTEFLRRLSLPGFICKPSGILNTARRALDRLRGGSRRSCAAAKIDWRDARIESLWKTASRHEGVIGDRQPGYLQWRYERCPLHRHELLGLTQGGLSDLLGYAVVYEGQQGQLKVPDLYVVSESSIAEALMALSRWADVRGASSIAFEMVNPTEAMLRALRRAGFTQRGDSDVLFALYERPNSPARTRPWFFLRGDEFYNTF